MYLDFPFQIGLEIQSDLTGKVAHSTSSGKAPHPNQQKSPAPELTQMEIETDFCTWMAHSGSASTSGGQSNNHSNSLQIHQATLVHSLKLTFWVMNQNSQFMHHSNHPKHLNIHRNSLNTSEMV
jgi:hypothetical protein